MVEKKKKITVKRGCKQGRNNKSKSRKGEKSKVCRGEQ